MSVPISDRMTWAGACPHFRRCADTGQPRSAGVQRWRIKRHHRFLLRLHLQQVDALDAAIAEIDREADAGLACFRDAVKQLSTIPGVSELSAQVILSEIGTDMGR